MTVFKDKRRGVWRYEFQHNGVRYTSREYRRRGEARAEEEQHRLAVRRRQKTGMGLLELSNLYLDFSQRKHAPQTYKYKQSVYRGFLEVVGDLPVAEVGPQHITQYLSTLKSNPVYNAHRKDLGALFAWGRRQLTLQIHNPVTEVEAMPKGRAEKRIPTQEEILRLLAAAAPGDERDIVLACLHTLGRIDEILRLRWRDVNLEKREVTLWTRKRRDGAYEPDTMPMSEDLHEVLARRWRDRRQEEWVFFNETTGGRYNHRPKMMAGLCKRAGIQPIGVNTRKVQRGKRKGEVEEHPLYYGFHALRHFMASFLADRQKVSTVAVSKLLRHRDVRTTEIYLHALDESHRQIIDSATKSLAKVPRKNEEGVAEDGQPLDFVGRGGRI